MFYHDVIQALPAVERFTRKYAGNNFTDDIMSEIKVKALELGFEKRGVKIESWLIEIAKIVCKANFYNKKKHQLQFVDFKPEQLNQYDYQPCLADEKLIEKLINTLPANYKHVLKLRMSGYKCSEISEILHLKNTIVKSTLWKARRKIKNNL